MKIPFPIEFSYSLVLCMRRISDRNLPPWHTWDRNVTLWSGWRQGWMEQDSLNKHVESSLSMFFHPLLLKVKVNLHCSSLPARTNNATCATSHKTSDAGALQLFIAVSPQQIYLCALYSHLLLSRRTLERKDTSVTQFRHFKLFSQLFLKHISSIQA